jgi:hypothetical protein
MNPRHKILECVDQRLDSPRILHKPEDQTLRASRPQAGQALDLSNQALKWKGIVE